MVLQPAHQVVQRHLPSPVALPLVLDVRVHPDPRLMLHGNVRHGRAFLERRDRGRCWTPDPRLLPDGNAGQPPCAAISQSPAPSSEDAPDLLPDRWSKWAHTRGDSRFHGRPGSAARKTASRPAPPPPPAAARVCARQRLDTATPPGEAGGRCCVGPRLRWGRRRKGNFGPSLTRGGQRTYPPTPRSPPKGLSGPVSAALAIDTARPRLVIAIVNSGQPVCRRGLRSGLDWMKFRQS